MTKPELNIEEANTTISNARRLAWGSNQYANKAERQAMANQAGAVAAAELATHFAIDIPKKSHVEAEEDRRAAAGQDEGQSR